MGVTINASMLNADVLRRASTPFIFCSQTTQTERLIEDGAYVPLNLNVELATALVKHPESIREIRASEEIMTIVAMCDKPILFKDYEILFDPRYRINPIRVFIESAKRQKVAVLWCGRLREDQLEYATPEYKDYHLFRIQDFDITCVE
jgi:hypothetical protein